MVAGAGLNDRKTVEFVVEHAPAAIERLAELGVPFNPTEGEGHDRWHLTREGGHSHRRIVHVDDATGRAVQLALEKAAHISLNIGGPDEAYLSLQPLHTPTHAEYTPPHAFKPAFQVDKTALLQNVAESCKAKMCDMIQAIGSPISARADEWSMTATTGS